ncbi:MAG TPA: fumarylacetoacetate hydrolase family protein [Gaiellaceae bacterium]|nr:fumarylacetoacetate hydrolase family protein [Gaiellaceae bacterium]
MSRGWRLVRLEGPDGLRLGAVAPDAPDRIALVDGADPLALLAPGALAAAAGETVEGVDPETLRPPAPWRLALPLDPPEVWCAGVTYERSRDARLEESQTEARDAYSLVYDAERPELFLKDAAGRRTVGPDGQIGVRSDASWSVPEPELGIVLGEGGALLGLTAGNDVSSRDIEGANPLYLPQAKVYAAACAIGPAVLVPDDWDEPFPIELRIRDAAGAEVFAGETSTARMKRGLAELAGFCVRDNPVPPGSVLLTGTGLVPEDDFTLEPGMVVEVGIAGIGRLVNTVATATDLL